MKTLKTFAVSLMILSLVMVFVAVGSASAEIYPETARVTALDYETDTVTVETFTGFLFAFEGCEDWMIGDCVALIMDDHGTALIFDDEIVMAQYGGWKLINWEKGEE